MKFDILSEKDNPLLKRKEYRLVAEHPGKETPSRYAIVPEVVKKLGSKEELTVIDKIFSERGSAKSRVKVLIYKDKKDVPKEKLERHEKKVKAYQEKMQGKKSEEKKPEAKEEAEKPGEEKKEAPEGQPAEAGESEEGQESAGEEETGEKQERKDEGAPGDDKDETKEETPKESK